MDILLFSVIILVSCAFQGVVGFGFALLAVPLSLTFLPASFVVPVISVVSVALNALLVVKINQPLDYRFIFRLVLSGVIGLPMGLWVLQYFSPWYIRLFAAVISVVSALIIMYRPWKFPKTTLVDYLVGYIAGILTTSVNINGAPIAALMLGRNLKKNQLRRTVALYFLSISLLSLPFFSSTLERLLDNPLPIALVIPAALIGGLLGNRISHRLHPQHHKTLVFAILCITSLYSIL